MKMNSEQLRLTNQIDAVFADSSLSDEQKHASINGLIDHAPNIDIDVTIKYLKHYHQKMTQYNIEDRHDVKRQRELITQYLLFINIMHQAFSPQGTMSAKEYKRLNSVTNVKLGRRAVKVYSDRAKQLKSKLPKAIADDIWHFKGVHPKDKAEARDVVMRMMRKEAGQHGADFAKFKQTHTQKHPYTNRKGGRQHE